MAGDVTRDEFQQFATRTDIIEREVEGEKLVTRYILEQTRRNGDDLATVNTRLGRIENKLEGVDLKELARKVDGLDRKVDGLDRKVDDLTKNLPRIVGDVVREVNRERDRKR